MKTIIADIAKHFKVYQGKGVTDQEIVAAEQRLGVAFPEQYKTYMKECGVLSFGSHEITGLGVDGYLNVVEATEAERKLGGSFPNDCILIENVGVDGILFVMDSTGCVYECHNGTKAIVAESFSLYLKKIAGLQ